MRSIAPGVADTILDTIGNTPIVRLHRLNPNPRVALWAKIEGANPAGSVKERIALTLIEGAERQGRLQQGMTLVESSSGNTGIGLAMVAAVKGYRLLICMPRRVSVERRKMLRAFGAEIRYTSPEGGSDEAWDLADAIAASDPTRYLRIHQYRSEDNVRAHRERTGPEIWTQTGGHLTHLVVGIGTTGTAVGTGGYLKERNPAIRVIGVEPAPTHTQQGLRNLSTSRVPPIHVPSLVDETILVEDRAAYETARRLAREEGIFAGISSGSATWAATRIAERLAEGCVVVVLPDRGEKYLSTPLFDFADDPQVQGDPEPTAGP